VRTSFHGHDCLVYVQPAGGSGPVVVRTLGDPHLADGSKIVLRINGPVLTWPRPPAPAGAPEPAT
jgi:hypothetical protein